VSPPRALFIHGAGAWGGQWAIWRRVFEAEGWAVDAPDLRPGPAGLAGTRLDDYVAQAVAALDAAPVDALVGASLGGLVALAAAARAATPPRAVVLVNPLPPAPFASHLPPFAADGDRVAWQTEGRFESTARALPSASFADRERAFRHWRDESAAVLREAHAGLRLPTPSMPALVIASEADLDVPPALSAALSEALGASLVRLPGGHVDPVMGASAASAAVAALGWLQGTLSAR
jgi:pimeloyl-ACP methyl ester carboxylesterase